MIYSDVINKGLILPSKAKYTMKDVNNLILNSLFKPIDGKTSTVERRK